MVQLPLQCSTRPTRIALEEKLEVTAQDGVRFGDFFGPKPGNNWFSQAFVKPSQPITNITNPGSKGVGHDWAYLPDAGEAFAELMDRESELSAFEQIHFRGHWDTDGTEIITAIPNAVGNASVPVKTLP